MTAKTKTIFSKYFIDTFMIMLIFVVIINIVVNAFMLHFTITKEESHRELIQNQANILISSITQDCTNLFAAISKDDSKLIIEQTNFDAIDDYDAFNVTNPLRTRISDNILDSVYIDSAYLYSINQKWTVSNKGFLNKQNSSQNIWLYDGIEKDSKEYNFWTKLIYEEKSHKSFIVLYRNVDFDIPSNFVSVIILDIAKLNNSLEKIIIQQGSVLILKNNTDDTILLKSGDSSIPDTAFETKKDIKNSIVFNKYSMYSSVFMEYNWQGYIAYKNEIVMDSIFRTVRIILLFSILALIAASFFAYNRAKRIYMPLKSIVTVMDNPQNYLYSKNLADDFQYSEIKFILETLFSIIREKNEIADKLEQNLNLLSDANKYAAEVQIQSHFIFNTLEIIYLEAYKLFGDDNIISEMVCNLSDLIRLSFKNDNKLITIKDEWEYTQKYLYIQSIRFENCFNVNWDIDESLYNLYCPKLILQPIIENAINHGIIPAQKRCDINIKICKFDHRIIITVQDTGVGMSAQKVRDIEALLNQTNIIPKKNIGISNVNLRIKLMFGEDYGCRILSSRLHEGTKIEIVIPVIDPEE